jgi:hypothetical protein
MRKLFGKFILFGVGHHVVYHRGFTCRHVLMLMGARDDTRVYERTDEAPSTLWDTL